MADKSLVKILRRGSEAWNKWRSQHRDVVTPDLSEADLSRAILTRANLSGANLSRADLSAASLFAANLSGANLNRANLGGAELILTLFNGTALTATNFSNSGMGATCLADVDLSLAKGLGLVTHDGPSTLGMDTLLQSAGNIPPEFLRACGVDPLIQDALVGSPASRSEAFTHLLAKGPRLFQRCFVSYATEDKVFVDRLQLALNKSGVDYWYAPEHGRWGEELRTQIGLEISARDRMLLVCSKKSLEKDWVRYEITKALENEKLRKQKIIFPIVIDNALFCWDDPRAKQILEVLAADFRKATKGDPFEKAVKKLLAALAAKSAAPA